MSNESSSCQSDGTQNNEHLNFSASRPCSAINSSPPKATTSDSGFTPGRRLSRNSTSSNTYAGVVHTQSRQWSRSVAAIKVSWFLAFDVDERFRERLPIFRDVLARHKMLRAAWAVSGSDEGRGEGHRLVRATDPAG